MIGIEKCLNDVEVKDRLLELLSAFDEICREHGIRYSLDSGTLLGAVRHKGFIPWDDDVDLILPRPDYDRLLNHPEWICAPYGMVSPYQRDAIQPFAKFVNWGIRAQEKELQGVMKEYLWIDLFPADAVPDNRGDAVALCARQAKLVKAYGRSVANPDGVENKAKRVARKVFRPFFKLAYPQKRTLDKIMSIAAAFPYGTTKFVSNLSWPGIIKDRWFPVEDFDELIELEFEGKSFLSIPHWHEYLSGLYGDYMSLPPVDQRISHGADVWEVQE